MRWHCLPPRPFRLFEAMWDSLRPLGMMRLLLAEQVTGTGSTLLAGSLLLMFGSTVFYAFNGSRRDALNLRPRDLIRWHAIHKASPEGYQYDDVGVVSANHHGLAQFKSK